MVGGPGSHSILCLTVYASFPMQTFREVASFWDRIVAELSVLVCCSYMRACFDSEEVVYISDILSIVVTVTVSMKGRRKN